MEKQFVRISLIIVDYEGTTVLAEPTEPIYQAHKGVKQFTAVVELQPGLNTSESVKRFVLTYFQELLGKDFPKKFEVKSTSIFPYLIPTWGLAFMRQMEDLLEQS